MVKNKGSDKDFEQSQIRFRAEVINTLAKKVRLTLHELKALDCVMRVGQPRVINTTGRTDFHVVAAIVQDTPGRPLVSKLRIEPVQREEYRYATLLLDKDMDGFTARMNDVEYRSWEAVYDAMLDEVEPSSKLTFRQLIELALKAEHDRIMKQGIESHAEFGTW